MMGCVIIIGFPRTFLRLPLGLKKRKKKRRKTERKKERKGVAGGAVGGCGEEWGAGVVERLWAFPSTVSLAYLAELNVGL